MKPTPRVQEIGAYEAKTNLSRLLIAQALETGATAITNDRHWKKYRCKVQW